jgi:maltooligosyltrehalose trehalohydrolase
MHKFTVWAPVAKRVSVKVDGKVHEMAGPDAHGWWSVSVQSAAAGSEYGFVIDDDASVYPDPCSQWQPNGVHGLSRVYDHARFVWSDERWQSAPLASAIFYELHLGTFTSAGTFDGAIELLDTLAELGITHVELMPVAAFAGDRGWGYDGVALFAVTENYGGPDGLKRFVDACHARGLAVVLDVVYNHFGPEGNYTGKFGPYITNNHNTPWGDAVNFEDAGSDEVRRFFCNNALMWLRDYHLDGLRIDAVHAFVDRSAIHFLEQLAVEIEALASVLGRRLELIAESDLNDPRVVTPQKAGGYGINAQWSDDFHHALFTLLHPETLGYYVDFGSMAQLAKALTRVFVYDGIYSKYRRRLHGRPVEGLSAHRFLGFIQNHDQVGNRAMGDRLEQIVGFNRAKIAAALVLTAPFIPLIFQGEEFAASTPFLYFAGHNDPELARAVSAGRRREFAAFGFTTQQIPDPEARETFNQSKLKWDELSDTHHTEMRDWYRSLIHLRRASVALNDGDLSHTSVRYDEAQRWIAIDRGGIQILCNLGNEAVTFNLAENFHLALVSHEAARPHTNILSSEKNIVLPPETLAILSSESRPK